MPLARRCAVPLFAAALTAVTTMAGTASGAVGASSGAVAGTPCLTSSTAKPTCIAGTLADGTAYQFAVPAAWNGTVLVDLDFASGGLDSALTAKLFGLGYARGGTTRTVTGWKLRQAIDNQAEALAAFTSAYGEPRWAIASSASMGGFVSAGVAQLHPDVFDAAVPFCGGLGGAVGQWNQKLDTVFTLKTLLFGATDLPVTGIPADVSGAQQAWIAAIGGAQATAPGRARIALAAAIGQLPAYGVAADGSQLPRPAGGDVAGLEQGLYLALAGGPLPYIGQAMSSRRQIETLAGPGASWNTGVDYAKQFAAARPEIKRAVQALYRDAGLDLKTDLATLAAAPRVAASPSAVDVLTRGLVFTGELSIPVLTVNAIGDQISTVAQQSSYQAAARSKGDERLLRQTYVEAAGHCGFTVEEQVAAIQVMSQRLDTGKWPTTSPAAMNARVAALTGTPGRYLLWRPERFSRRYWG